MPEQRGALIAPISKELRALAAGHRSLCIYYDHVGEGRQRLWSFFGPEPHRWNLLSAVDILVGDAQKHEAVLIIEIEETAAAPKKLLGDLFAVALADAIATKDRHHYAVGPNTALWLCFPATPRGHQRERDDELAKRIGRLVADAASLPRVEFVVAPSRDRLVEAVCAKLREWFVARPPAGSQPAGG